MEKAKILLVMRAGESSLRRCLQTLYQVLFATKGAEAIEIAWLNRPDLILIGIETPDGLQLCEALRCDERTQVIPILILTAFETTAERIRAYQAGADDYIPEGLERPEFLTRIEDKLRRFHCVKQARRYLVCGNLTLNLERRTAWLGETLITLDLDEFSLLCCLVEYKDEECEPEKLLSVMERSAEGASLKSLVHSMRQKLGLFDHAILSLGGGGYRLAKKDK